MNELYTLMLGRNDQLEQLYDRFRELGIPEPNEDDATLGRLFGVPTARTLADYRHRRTEMLLALLDEYADEIDASAEQMGRFSDAHPSDEQPNPHVPAPHPTPVLPMDGRRSHPAWAEAAAHGVNLLREEKRRFSSDTAELLIEVEPAFFADKTSRPPSTGGRTSAVDCVCDLQGGLGWREVRGVDDLGLVV